MTSQQWLVRWMEVKAEYANFPAYFNEEDKQELLALSDELAMRVMLEIKLCSVKYNIGPGTCPFCVITRGFDTRLFYYMDCSICSYGKRHGVCDVEEGNDYEAFRRCLGEDPDEGILENHLALTDGVINQFVNSYLGESGNSQLTPTPVNLMAENAVLLLTISRNGGI